MHRRILVTGAAGFVGSALIVELQRIGHYVRAAVRRLPRASLPVDTVLVGDISSETNWSAALDGIDTVVHLAARVHVMHDTSTDPLAEFRAVNVAGTAALARASGAMGVQRLVFVSSIKVNGEETRDRPFSADDVPAPADPYAISKSEAEYELRCIERQTGIDITVVRPPLVYGPGVGGNFLRLLKMIDAGIPLPFGAINNQRSMIFNGNLVSGLVACATRAEAAGKTFLISDAQNISTPELIECLARYLGRRARLLRIPAGLLRTLGRVAGKGAEIGRLTGSLVVDNSRLRETLGWVPPVDVTTGLRETADWFRKTHSTSHV